MLGTWSGSRPVCVASVVTGQAPPTHTRAASDARASVWLAMHASADGDAWLQRPCVSSLHVGGSSDAASVQVVLYSPPDARRLHYVSATPHTEWLQPR